MEHFGGETLLKNILTLQVLTRTDKENFGLNGTCIEIELNGTISK